MNQNKNSCYNKHLASRHCQVEESCKTSMDGSLIREEEEEAWKMCEPFSFSCITENVNNCGYITTENRS